MAGESTSLAAWYKRWAAANCYVPGSPRAEGEGPFTALAPAAGDAVGLGAARRCTGHRSTPGGSRIPGQDALPAPGPCRDTPTTTTAAGLASDRAHACSTYCQR